MKASTRFLSVLIAAGLFLPSCAPRSDVRVLDEREFAVLYTRLARAGVTLRAVGGETSVAKARAEAILSETGISRREVEATVRWYNEDVTRWRGFYDAVVRMIQDSLAQ